MQLERFAKRCAEPELRLFARAAVATRALEPADLQPCRPVQPSLSPAAAAPHPVLSRLEAVSAGFRHLRSLFAEVSSLKLFLLTVLVAVLSRPSAHFLVGRFLVLSFRWALQQTFGLLFQCLDALLLEFVLWLRGVHEPPSVGSFMEASCPACLGLGPFGQVLLSTFSVFLGALLTHLNQRFQLPNRAGRPVLRL